MVCNPRGHVLLLRIATWRKAPLANDPLVNSTAQPGNRPSCEVADLYDGQGLVWTDQEQK